MRCAVCLLVALSSAPAAASVWPSSQERIAEALGSADPAERRAAAARLTELPPELGRTLSRRALTDQDAEVKLYAAHAAATLGAAGAGDDVVGWLQDRDARLRSAACELIEAAPTATSVQALARVLSDAKPEVRQAAAEAMGASGMPETVSPLLGHLDDGATNVRHAVVHALGRLGDARAVVPLISRLQDQEPEVRREAARALGIIGDKQAEAPLELALQDKSAPVRVEALVALGRIGSPASVTAIAAELSHPTHSVDPNNPGAGLGADQAAREAALTALGRIGSAPAIKTLTDELEREGPVGYGDEPSAPVRRALVLAGPPARAALIALLGSSSSRACAAAAYALGEMATGDGVASAAIVRAAQRGAVDRDGALHALMRLRDKRALTYVLEHLADADADARRLAVEVASALLDPADQDGRAVDVVRERVLDLGAPAAERASLVRLLGKTGSPRALPLILSLAPPRSPITDDGSKAPPLPLRIAVAGALGDLGIASAQVDAVLLDALDQPSEGLRQTAAKALAKIGRDAAAAALLARLTVSAEQDRAAIGIAISGALARVADPALIAKVARALPPLSGGSRDALIEGLGRNQTAEALRLLAELSRSADPDDRRKVAEALAARAGGQDTALALLADPDSSVRANAAWALGRVGGKQALAPLSVAIGDSDIAVAGNAALALGLVAARAGTPEAAKARLCGALGSWRSTVRTGALVGLRLLGAAAPCASDAARRVLAADSSWRARLAAVAVLQSTPAADTAGATRNAHALSRCALEDRDAAVASRCAAGLATAPRARPSGADDVLVYVVPDGASEPVARAPFALELPDGTFRLGVADRRGALFMTAAPAGKIELGVPAALAP